MIPNMKIASRLIVQLLSILCALASIVPAQAYVVNLAPAPRAIYLQVGTGGAVACGGGTIAGGGVPSNSAVINEVSVTVPAANVGAGVQAMASGSPVANSLYDNFVFCTLATQVYVAGFLRSPVAGAAGTLTATSPANLTSGALNLSFNQISWASGGNGDAVATIPSGTFVAGATQTIYTATQNTWFESCLSFSYANNTVVAAGTYTGRVTYTLSSP